MKCSRPKLFISFLGIIYLFFFYVQPISAHVLETSGSIGAVVHVSPEDDPIAGEPTDFFFEFKDKDSKFKPDNCDCKVVILKSGQESYTAPLFQGSTDPSLSNASFSYTFPEKDVYVVKVIGTPLTPDAFQSFELKYDIRVARESENKASANQTGSIESKKSGFGYWVSTHIPHLIGGFIVIALLVFALVKQQSAAKNK
jgi:hypothetical protein